MKDTMESHCMGSHTTNCVPSFHNPGYRRLTRRIPIPKIVRLRLLLVVEVVIVVLATINGDVLRMAARQHYVNAFSTSGQTACRKYHSLYRLEGDVQRDRLVTTALFLFNGMNRSPRDLSGVRTTRIGLAPSCRPSPWTASSGRSLQGTLYPPDSRLDCNGRRPRPDQSTALFQGFRVNGDTKEVSSFDQSWSSKTSPALQVKKDRLPRLTAPALFQKGRAAAAVATTIGIWMVWWALRWIGQRTLALAIVSRWLWNPVMIYLHQCHRPIVRTLLVLVSMRVIVGRILQKRRQATDATSEWGRYAQYPAARGRALTLLLFGQVLPMYILTRLLPKSWPIQRYLERTSGKLLADGLLQLGPLYIKLGQIISCRENMVPASWIKSLERLQDQVPAKRGDEVLQLAYAAWPRGPDDFHETFVGFDTTPLAAASLGQVHRAMLRASGQPVALKLQRPYLRQIYDQDFRLLTKIAAAVDSLGSAGQVGGISQSWSKIFEDAESILYKEIDYRTEADHGVRFCREFGLAPGGRPAANVTARSRDGEPLPSAASWLRAPFVYRELSSEKVLVMEYVPSIKVTRTDQLEAAGVTDADKEYLADCLGRAYLRQFCCHCFFSTDPHPGNLGVEVLNKQAIAPQDRVRLVFYDFGQVATLTPDQGEGMLDIIEAIVDMDADRSISSFAKMGVLKPDAKLDIVRAKVADNFKTGKIKANRKRLTSRGYQFKAAQPNGQTSSVSNITTESNITASVSSPAKDSEVLKYFTLPAEYAFVGRALTQMQGVGKTLDPDFDFISAAAPWIFEIKGAGKYLQDEARKWVSNMMEQVSRFFQPLGTMINR